MKATIQTHAGPLTIVAARGTGREPVELQQDSRYDRQPDGKPNEQTIYLNCPEVEMVIDLLKHALKALK